MKKWIYLILGILCFTFSLQDASSQEASRAENILSEYNVSIFDSNSGLTSGEITSIVQTRDEYIWVGSYSGLFRYNGNQFVKFEIDSRLNTITTLYADTQNRLWIGTNSNGVACYEPETQEIRFYTVRDGLTSDAIRCITEDGQKNIYIGTTNYLSIITADNRVRSPFSSQRISVIDDLAYSPREDCIAGVTNNGDLFYVKKQRNIAKISYDENPGEYFRCISTSAQGVFLVGTSENTICTASYIHDKIVYSPIFTISDLSYINDIIPDRVASGMFICAENGVVHYANNGKISNLTSDNFNNSLIDAFRDVQGNIWLASSQKGICKLSHNPFSDVFEKSGVEPAIVNSIIKVGQDLYIGSDSGLIIIDEETNTQKKNKLTEQLTGARIRHIMQDSQQNLWISTYSSPGLYCISKNQKITLFNESTGTQGGLFCFTLELQDGSILAASNTGLTYIKNGVVDAVLGQDDGLSTPQILCAVQREDGTIYAGSGGGGVYIIKNQQVKERIHTSDGLENKIISRISPVEDGLLYITTNEIYYHNGDTIRRLENFPYNNNYDLYVAGDQAWISSSAGIFVIPLKDLLEDKEYNYTLLDKSRGLDSSITSNAWNYADAKNTYYICCDDGVKKCSFTNITNTLSDVKLGIDEIVINNEITLYPIHGTYEIPAAATHISIQPMVLDYTLSNPLIHIYMEGFDEQGMTQRKNQINNITFANLTYGSYKFHIQILDASGHTILQDTVVHITKEAQFFEHMYFKIYLAMFCVCMVAFFAWMVARLASISIIRQQMKATQSAKREAERANNAKTLFLANMSHEIRTPINAILGMDELILRQKTNPEVQKYATDIRNAGNTLLAIVNDILDFSKIESGKMTLVNDNYKMGQLLQDVSAILQIRAKEKNLLSKIILDQNIPGELLGDATKIKQILTNLVSNAIKYTEKGSVTFRATLLSMEGDTASIGFSVADTGIGIKKSELDKLFETFERLDEKRNAKVQGTGLGLSITKQLLELMGSEIKVVSEYNKGSTFSFVLKQTIINTAPIGNVNTLFGVNKAELTHSTAFSAPDAKILVVDDNTMNLTVIEGLLQPTKIQIDTATSGKMCLERIQQKHYDIIFLDHMMPNMDGIETFAHIKETENLCKDVPIIVLTANAIQGAREMYLKKGFTDYLPKPVSSTQLESMIQKYLPQDLLCPVSVEFIEESDTEETNSENKTETSSTDYLELCEINRQAGLSINGNLEDLYQKLLTIFYDSGEEKITEICDTYQKENWQDYEIHVHALKSSAKSLGADSLSDAAKALEFAAKDENIDYIREHNDDVIALYRTVLEECHKLLTAPASIPIIQKKEKDSHTTQDTVTAIKNLRDAILDHDHRKADEQLEILLSVAFPMRKVSLLEKLQFSVNNSDWKNAEKFMNKL